MTNPTEPVRLQLSRRKGFDLQAVSRATNGLPAINVARPSCWGNPWAIGDTQHCGIAFSAGPLKRSDVVEMHRDLVSSIFIDRPQVLDPLRGCNLACWCGPREACHADNYLNLLKLHRCEPVEPCA